jgi:hypothetical protein
MILLPTLQTSFGDDGSTQFLFSLGIMQQVRKMSFAGLRAAAFIGKDHLTQVCSHVTHFPKIPPKPYDVILTGVNLSHLSFHYDVIGILSD